MNYYIADITEKSETPTKRLIDFLFEAKKLGLNQVNTDDLIRHLKILGELEENLLKSTFMDGRDYQGNKENEFIPFAESADIYFQENFIRYI